MVYTWLGVVTPILMPFNFLFLTYALVNRWFIVVRGCVCGFTQLAHCGWERASCIINKYGCVQYRLAWS